MKLIDALRIDSNTKLSLVGSGGKTSALIRLGQEWPDFAIVAATAHLGKDQIGSFNKHVAWDIDRDNDQTLSETTLITGPSGEGNMLRGVDPTLWGNLDAMATDNKVPIFIESDGSKTRPLKAPADHEPAIPAWVNHVVVSVGLSVVGKPLSELYVHRPAVFSTLSGLDIGRHVTLHSIVKMLCNPQGGLKNIPRHARKTVLLNQMDLLFDKSSLLTIEQQLLGHFDSVVCSTLKCEYDFAIDDSFRDDVLTVKEKIAGIIMAAGKSQRMGQPKALMEWKGIPFVRQCALQAITAGLKPIHIIAGQEYEIIQEIVKDLPVQVVQNPDWNEGQSSSLRVAIKSLPRRIGGAVFMLVDQPQIPVALIRRLITEHSSTLNPIVLPISCGRRANPVLFDRKTFHSLSSIQGDFGGRMIFSQFPLQNVPWFDETILLDVDTPEDYARLMELP